MEFKTTLTDTAPVAVADSYSVDEDATLSVPAAGVLANDTDVDPGTTLTAQLVSTTTHGSLTLNPDGSFFYTPQANFTGSDAFTYTASDGETSSNAATVTITVNPVNDAPVAVGDCVRHGRRRAARRERARRAGQRHRHRRPAALGSRRDARRPRNGGAERERQLHVHAECELQRARQLHLPRQ